MARRLRDPAVERLRRLAGKVGRVRLMSSLEPFSVVPLDHPGLARAFQVGGAPVGCVWVVHGPTQGGKCLGPGTPVLRHDGRLVNVEDVHEGDLLMGPDSRPRRVLATGKGRGPMYRIVPHKGRAWVCNDVHVLTLVHTETGEVEDVELQDYLRRSAYWKHCRKLFQPEVVVFDEMSAPLPVDPYFLGVWFGDGARDLSHGIKVSKPDAEIEAACRDVAGAFGLHVTVDVSKERCPTYRVVAQRGQDNPLLQLMREIVGEAERIPHRYLTARVEERRALLAGLLDTDGYLHEHDYYEIAQDRPGVAADIAFLARSLGFRVTERVKVVNGKPYQRLSILGDASALPLRIERKRPTQRPRLKDSRRTGFRVEAIGEGDYFGFELDGDGRFLLGDFTVTHNTVFIARLIQNFQRAGGTPMYVDAEMIADQTWFAKLGVDLGRCLYYGRTDRDKRKERGQPLSYETTVTAVDAVIKDFQEERAERDVPPLLIAVDSINRLVPESFIKELAKKGGESLRRGAGREQALMSAEWLMGLGPRVCDDDIAFVIIAHEGAKQNAKPWERDWFVKGGGELLFEAGVQVRVSFAGQVKETVDGEEVVVGRRHAVRVLKNKLGRCDEVAYMFTSNGLGKAPLGFDVRRELVVEAGIRGKAEVPKDLTLGSAIRLGARRFKLADLYGRHGDDLEAEVRRALG